jgi:hypothetical protein
MNKNPNDQSKFVTVQFSTVEEFLDELKADDPNIEPIIRLTKVFQSSQTLPIQHITVEAAILRDTPPIVQCIKMIAHCGDRYDSESASPSMKRAETIQGQIQDAAVRLNLEVRGGMYR